MNGKTLPKSALATKRSSSFLIALSRSSSHLKPCLLQRLHHRLSAADVREAIAQLHLRLGCRVVGVVGVVGVREAPLVASKALPRLEHTEHLLVAPHLPGADARRGRKQRACGRLCVCVHASAVSFGNRVKLTPQLARSPALKYIMCVDFITCRINAVCFINRTTAGSSTYYGSKFTVSSVHFRYEPLLSLVNRIERAPFHQDGHEMCNESMPIHWVWRMACCVNLAHSISSTGMVMK